MKKISFMWRILSKKSPALLMDELVVGVGVDNKAE